jgi:hypothetical protein
MSFLDSLSTRVHEELKSLALKHPSYESFMQDLQRLGDTMYHNARAQAEVDGQQALTEIKQDAEKDLVPQPVGDDVDGANAQGDGGQPVTTPAEPASPASDAGLPTSNVGIVDPNPPPDDSPPI